MWKSEKSVNFQTVVMNPGGGTIQTLGDTVCPNAGWVMAYTTSVPNNDQSITVAIDVAGPGPGGLSFRLTDPWTPGLGGLLFIPWPSAIVTVAASGGLPGVATWRANYIPIDDLAQVVGIPSSADVQTPVPLAPGANTKIGGRIGCTGWTVYPDHNTTVLVELFSLLNGIQTRMGVWSVGPGAPLPGAAQPQLQAMGWKRPPTGGLFSFDITNIGGANYDGAALQRFDLRSWADAGT